MPSSDLIKLNIGCGENPLEGFLNLDVTNESVNIEAKIKPDIICDVRKNTIPLKDATCSDVWMIHSLEHMERCYWEHIFREIFRVLIPEGNLALSYPEFDICAKYYINNYKGQKEFWIATLYGRQLYPGDYHVTPILTNELEQKLLRFGFNEIRYGPQPQHEYYTFLKAKKHHKLTREDVLRKEIFGKELVK